MGDIATSAITVIPFTSESQGIKDKLVFTRGGNHGVWIYLNNLNATETPVKYCAVPPGANPGFVWADALAEGPTKPVQFLEGCFIAPNSQPQVLVQRKAATMTTTD